MPTIALVGHCGADCSYLHHAVKGAAPDAKIVRVDDERRLAGVIQSGVDLLLINRQLDWGFDETEGVELIRRLRAQQPQVRLMLISNYPEAQQAAVEAGAVQGFGKREIGSAKVAQLLGEALQAGTSEIRNG